MCEFSNYTLSNITIQNTYLVFVMIWQSLVGKHKFGLFCIYKNKNNYGKVKEKERTIEIVLKNVTSNKSFRIQLVSIA